MNPLGVVWLNARLVRRDEAVVPATSLGWLYGVGAFETMRWRHPRGVCRFAAHTTRLLATTAYLGLNVGDPDAARRRYADAVAATVRANRVERDVVVRLTVASGAEGESPVEMVHLRDIPYDGDALSRGVEAYLEPSPRWTELARHKTLNYASHVLARRVAAERGCFDAIFRDPFGYLLEGAATNLFVVVDGSLTTPSTMRPLLPGVTRGVVLEMARRSRGVAVERDVTENDLRSASEAFLTNAVVGIVPLIAVRDASGGRFRIGSGAVGEQTRALIRAYEALCEAELNV